MSGTWEAESLPVDDPLQPYMHKPVISRGGPNTTFVGRVVLELWSDGDSDDANMIAMTADAVDGRPAKLLERISSGLRRRLEKENPFV